MATSNDDFGLTITTDVNVGRLVVVHEYEEAQALRAQHHDHDVNHNPTSWVIPDLTQAG